jgi:hypothetical protein
MGPRRLMWPSFATRQPGGTVHFRMRRFLMAGHRHDPLGSSPAFHWVCHCSLNGAAQRLSRPSTRCSRSMGVLTGALRHSCQRPSRKCRDSSLSLRTRVGLHPATGSRNTRIGPNPKCAYKLESECACGQVRMWPHVATGVSDATRQLLIFLDGNIGALYGCAAACIEVTVADERMP